MKIKFDHQDAGENRGLLPLGVLDPATRRRRSTSAGSRHAARQALGYDRVVTEETKRDPYIVLALAAQATGGSPRTAVAIAFRAARR